MAHVAPRVSAVADGVLPLLQVAPGREAQAGPRPAARSGPKGGGARAQPERSGDRQPGRQRDRRGRTRTRLHDGAKRLSGRKRHLLVDTGGLVLGARVHAASLHDRDGARVLLGDELKEELPRLELLWADGAYTRGFREWAKDERGWRVEVPHHPDRQLWRYGLEEKPRGFLVLPRRWVVERTFAWLGHARRLAKDYERLPETGVAMIHWAMSRIMLRRLTGATR
jgi:transposase